MSESIDAELSDSFSLSEPIDIKYIKDMKEYETKAEKETNGLELSVEEENNIVCRIKEDIVNQLRTEMASELGLYRMESTCTDSSVNLADQEQMDPEIRKGLYQIRKLDKILLRKMQKEKQVKRDRILLQKRLREELNEIENNNKQLSREIKTNVMKFLALKPPVRHNEGLNEETGDDDFAHIFQTELSPVELNIDGDAESRTKSTDDAATPSKLSTKSKLSSKPEFTNDNKNFIKRNIQLASHAAEPVQLTETEKQRLEILLADLDDTNMDLDKASVAYPTSPGESENPFRVASLCAGPTSALSLVGSDLDSEVSVVHQLRVESRLRMCLGDDSYRYQQQQRGSISGSVSVLGPPPSSVQNAVSVSETDLNIDDGLGEEALRTTKFDRESHKRIKQIDEELSKFQMASDIDEETLAPLDPTTLAHLVHSAREDLSRQGRLPLSSMWEIDGYSDAGSTSDLQLQPTEATPHYLTGELLASLLRDPRHCSDLGNLASDIDLDLHEITTAAWPKMAPITEESSHLEPAWFGSSVEEASSAGSRLSSSQSLSRNSQHLSDTFSTVSVTPSSTTRFPDINLFRQMTSPPPSGGRI